jgi:hypothetical protein
MLKRKFVGKFYAILLEEFLVAPPGTYLEMRSVEIFVLNFLRKFH